MASYLDQIPKQLAARRKAFRAAKDNPALLPSCWAIVRSIANNMYDYMRNSVIGGCTFPDRPVYLSPEDTAFLNFGTTPKLLFQDFAWMEAETAGQPPPEGDNPQPSAESAAKARRQLARLAGTFGDNAHASRVFNLESWLQAMYRDRLDVDFAEDLQRQIDALNAYMDSVPKSIAATGLNAKLAKGVMDAFTLFKTITGSSHQLDREKMSFVDRRSYVNTIQKIELIMVKADQSLGTAVAGKSVVRELFGLWKDANYEMMALTQQLRALWAGTSLDDRIQELANLLGAVQKALNRSTEESFSPEPQLPVYRADSAVEEIITYQGICDVFRSLTFYDMIVGDNNTLKVREIRKFGPLALVIGPGSGQPRYCREIRKLSSAEDEENTARRGRGGSGDTGSMSKEREMDVDRRVRYPLNCLVAPVACDRSTFADDLADAWLEYNQTAFAVQFKEFSEAAKAAAPAAFAPPANSDAKDLPPTYARHRLGRLVRAFVRWSNNGTEPAESDLPGFPAFRDMALSRLKPDGFLIPLRYRPTVELYAEAGVNRRMGMWKRYLGPRYALDRQLVAVSVLMKDWNALKSHLRLLPTEQTKENSSLANGFVKAHDASDPFGEHKAVSLFRKFLTEQADLRSALVSVESQTSIEVETLRTQSESLGRTFQYDQASETMMRQQMSRIQEKRLRANNHIDQYLIGLLYAMDGNLEAAERTLVKCLVPQNRQVTDEIHPAPVPEEIGEEWFAERFAPRDGKFDRRLVPGEDGLGTVNHELAYYNLGIVYMKLNRPIEACLCFKGVIELSPPERSFLCRRWAAEHAETCRAKIASEEEAKKAAARSTKDVAAKG
ncbi:MAG: hypothetical protein LBS30_00770 [Planctomycetota bacterium]|jgi:tetratricopeptide (TPR) repeat protein|nr:hypothetical protein [Planctomycetota bacterium]